MIAQNIRESSRISKGVYEPLAATEDDLTQLPPPKSNRKKTKILISGACTVAILIIVYFSTYMWTRISPSMSKSEAPTSKFSILPSACGTNHTEALSMGCVFDVLVFSWIPPACYDQELVSEFMVFHDWDYYLDRPPTIQISAEDVAKGENDHVYVSWEWHIRHCTYEWLRMHRATIPGGPMDTLDSITASLGHTKHCEKMLLQKQSLNDTNTIVNRKFADCVTLR